MTSLLMSFISMTLTATRLPVTLSFPKIRFDVTKVDSSCRSLTKSVVFLEAEVLYSSNGIFLGLHYIYFKLAEKLYNRSVILSQDKYQFYMNCGLNCNKCIYRCSTVGFFKIVRIWRLIRRKRQLNLRDLISFN